MKKYKKSKLALFLKILGSLIGILGIIAVVFTLVKYNRITNEFEKMIAKVLLVYAIGALVGTLITFGTLWGIALILDNQLRIEEKLDEIKINSLKESKVIEFKDTENKN